MPYFLRSKDLKEQLERALNEMQELRSARDRQAAMVCYIILFIMHRKILEKYFLSLNTKYVHLYLQL